MRLWTIAVLAFVMQSAFAQSNTGIVAKLSLAAKATGVEYFAARSNLVSLGAVAVPRLKAIAENANEEWRVRLMAGIVVERVEHADDIAVLVQRDWRNDPEYQKEWEMNRAGPVEGLAPLVTKRYREDALWWFYLELTWKRTAEHSTSAQAYMHEDIWRGAAATACIGSPVYNLLLRVLDESIRRDIGFKDFRTRGDFHILVESATNSALPYILDILPLTPLTAWDRSEVVFRALRNMGRPEDVPLVEKHYRDRGEEVPTLLREPLQKLRERQNSNAVSK